MKIYFWDSYPYRFKMIIKDGKATYWMTNAYNSDWNETYIEINKHSLSPHALGFFDRVYKETTSFSVKLSDAF